MPADSAPARSPADTRRKLLDAARGLMLQRGFTATGVDQICAEAGVTKGAFFHHFRSKEELGQAALADWADHGMSLYAAAQAEPAREPLDHLHRFFDVMIGFVEESPAAVVCLVGMLSQEMAGSNPALRECCDRHLTAWAELVRRMLSAAKSARRPKVDFDPAEVAWFLNSLWQGSMLIGKTRANPRMIVRNLEHGRAYIDSLFAGTAPAVAARSARRRGTRRASAPATAKPRR